MAKFIIGAIVLLIITSIVQASNGEPAMLLIIVAIVASILILVLGGWKIFLIVLAVAGAIALTVYVVLVIYNKIDELIKLHNLKNLTQELENSCTKLGYMNKRMWEMKLQIYVNKKYPDNRSFSSITEDFAKSSEEEHLIKDDSWFDQYMQYLIDNTGATIVKIQEEVKMPSAFQWTHYTDNRTILKNKIDKVSIPQSADVPALLSAVKIDTGNGGEDILYSATAYARKRYGGVSEGGQNKMSGNSQEIDFNDL